MLNEVMELRMGTPLMAVIIPSGWFHSGLQPSATSWSALINEGCNLSRHTNTQVHTYTCTYMHIHSSPWRFEQEYFACLVRYIKHYRNFRVIYVSMLSVCLLMQGVYGWNRVIFCYTIHWFHCIGAGRFSVTCSVGYIDIPVSGVMWHLYLLFAHSFNWFVQKWIQKGNKRPAEFATMY